MRPRTVSAEAQFARRRDGYPLSITAIFECEVWLALSAMPVHESVNFGRTVEISRPRPLPALRHLAASADIVPVRMAHPARS